MTPSQNRRSERITPEELSRLNQRLIERLQAKNAQIRELIADNDRLRLLCGEHEDEIERLQDLVENLLDDHEVTRQLETAGLSVEIPLALYLDTARRTED